MKSYGLFELRLSKPLIDAIELEAPPSCLNYPRVFYAASLYKGNPQNYLLLDDERDSNNTISYWIVHLLEDC